jgi:hypothetical protein
LIRRRCVFFVEGYDPQGAAGYYRMFQRERKHLLNVWGVHAKVGDLEIDSEHIAHWNIEAVDPKWRVTTRYEFLRLEAFLSSSLAQPLIQQFPRALSWIVHDAVSGAMLRIFLAAWRFGVHMLVLQVLFLAWIAVAIGGGALAMILAARFADLPLPVAIILGLVAGIAICSALKPLANRWSVIRFINCWACLREFARGKPTGLERPVEALAERLVAAARAGEVDEILIVGHSAGGVTSPVVVTRALEIDPELGRHGPRIILMTVGSLLPACALDPPAHRLRAVIRRLAVERSVLWIDCQAGKDPMNFWEFDPVAGVGIEVDGARCNPAIWAVRFRDMLSDETYRRLRFKYIRLHYQYVMGNERRASYDYFLLVCGPVSVAEWARQPADTLRTYTADAALCRDDLQSS